MRYSASEKREMIKLVEQSSLPVSQTLRRLDINKSTFYNWLQRYRCAGDEALTDKHPGPNRAWNQLPESRQIAVVDLALSEPELSPGNWRSNTRMNRPISSQNPRSIDCSRHKTSLPVRPIS